LEEDGAGTNKSSLVPYKNNNNMLVSTAGRGGRCPDARNVSLHEVMALYYPGVPELG